MTLQPHDPQRPAWSAPPGWYPQGGVQRYWDGRVWTGHVAPLPQQPQTVVVQAPAPRAVSGMTTGGMIVNGLLAVCTCGLWLPFWWLKERLGRRRIRY